MDGFAWFREQTSRRRFLHAALITGSGLLAAACGGAPASPTTGTTAAATKPAAGEATKPAAAGAATPAAGAAGAAATKPAAAAQPTAGGASAPAAQVARNRTLISAGLGGEHPGGYTDIDNFNPYSPGLSRSGFYQAATEGLFYYNMIADEFVPWIGESYTYNDDFTEVTLKLRNGVTWSDGQPFTSKDVVFTFQLLAKTPELSNAGEVKRTVKEVSAPDDQTVKFVLNFRNPRFVFDMLTFRADIGIPMVPEHIWKDVAAATFKNYDPAKGLPLGTGPYKLVATDVQQKIWDRRDDWWGAKTGFKPAPKVERLIFLPGMNEITMAQKIIANEIDLAFSLTPANMKSVQAQNPKVITHSDKPPYGYLDWWPIGLGFNHEQKPFDDPDVRWAVSYAINRDQVIKFAFQGFTNMVPLPFPSYPGLKPFMDSIKDLLEQYPTTAYDLKKTDELMTKKGFKKDQEGFWVGSDGQRVQIQIVTFPQHPSTTPQAPIITEQLRQAGFDTTFQLPADFVTRIYTGEAKAFLWGHGGSMRDPYKTYDLYHIRHYKPTGESTNGLNLYRWKNQEFSNIVDEMSKLPEDDPKLKDLFHQATEIYLKELPDIPLIDTVVPVPMNTTYWQNWPSDQKPYIHEGFWHRTALLLFLGVEPVQ